MRIRTRHLSPKTSPSLGKSPNTVNFVRMRHIVAIHQKTARIHRQICSSLDTSTRHCTSVRASWRVFLAGGAATHTHALRGACCGLHPQDWLPGPGPFVFHDPSSPCILGTHHEKGAQTFWSVVNRLPLSSNAVLCWKFCHVFHKLLRDGHPNVSSWGCRGWAGSQGPV